MIVVKPRHKTKETNAMAAELKAAFLVEQRRVKGQAYEIPPGQGASQSSVFRALAKWCLWCGVNPTDYMRAVFDAAKDRKVFIHALASDDAKTAYWLYMRSNPPDPEAKPRPTPAPKPVPKQEVRLTEKGRAAYVALWRESRRLKTGKAPPGEYPPDFGHGLNDACKRSLEAMAQHAELFGVSLDVYARAGFEMFQWLGHGTEEHPHLTYGDMGGYRGIQYYSMWEAAGKAKWYICEDGVARPLLPFPLYKKDR